MVFVLTVSLFAVGIQKTLLRTRDVHVSSPSTHTAAVLRQNVTYTSPASRQDDCKLKGLFFLSTMFEIYAYFVSTYKYITILHLYFLIAWQTRDLSLKGRHSIRHRSIALYYNCNFVSGIYIPQNEGLSPVNQSEQIKHQLQTRLVQIPGENIHAYCVHTQPSFQPCIDHTSLTIGSFLFI